MRDMKRPAPRIQHPQASFDAALVHGVMLVSVAATVTVAGLLGTDAEGLPEALGVGGAASLVLAVWSLVLAMRARRKAEQSRWPRVVITLLIIELVAGGATFLLARCSANTLYHWAAVLGLPVVLPVLGFATFLAAPVAWWRAGRAEKRETKEGGTPWPARRRWKRRLAWFCPMAVLVVLVALPVPLFVFYARAEWHMRDYRWPQWANQHTPEAVGETAAGMLSWSSQPRFVRLYAYVLQTGRVSSGRLIAELESPVLPVANAALSGLMRSHQPVALEVARRVAEGRFSPNHSDVAFVLGTCFKCYAGQAEIERCLDPAQKPWPPTDFLRGLFGAPTYYVDYVRALEKLCDATPPDREAVLKRLAEVAEREDAERLWAKYLADKKAERRKQAIEALAFIKAPDAALSVIAAGLENSDPALRKEMAGYVQDILLLGHERASPQVLQRLVRAMLPLLDEQDVGTMQDAAWVLVTLIKAPELEKRVRAATWKPEDDGDRRPQPALTPEASDLLNDVRAAARQWLGGKAAR